MSLLTVVSSVVAASGGVVVVESADTRRFRSTLFYEAAVADIRAMVECALRLLFRHFPASFDVGGGFMVRLRQ